MFDFLKKSKVKNKQKPINNKLGVSLLASLFGKKSIDDNLLIELETILLSSDIGLNTTNKVLANVRKNTKRKELKNEDSLYNLVKNELQNLFIIDNKLNVENNQTFVILVVGVNGAGKTTTIGKLAKKLQNEGKSVMLAAGDTFRAAAVEQLQTWGERNNIPVIAQKTGSDSAAVIFDAYQSAKNKNIDVLIADTSGRLHTQDNLMAELVKIKKVLTKSNADIPHETMLVIDGTSGQNAINQALEFNKMIGLTGISITKLDGTAKGGVVFAISDELGLPIRFIGVGEGIDDLIDFDAEDFSASIFNT